MNKKRPDVLNLPTLPMDVEKITSEQKYTVIAEFLRQITILAKFVDRNYKAYVVAPAVLPGTLPLKDPPSKDPPSKDPPSTKGKNRPTTTTRGDDEGTLETIYEYVMEYALKNARNPFFTGVSKYKLPGEDIERKSSPRTHLFWETCRLYVVLRTVKLNGEECTRKDLDRVKTEMGLAFHTKSPANFSQRELNQAFFMLSTKWKTVAYDPSLVRYVRALTFRMCEFFCYSSTEEEMDDEDLRDMIPMAAVPKNTIRNKRRRDVSESEDDESEEDDLEGVGLTSTRFYRPNLDFVMMCQFRFYRFEGDVFFYESIPKVTYDEESLSDYVSLTKMSYRRKTLYDDHEGEAVKERRVPMWILDVTKKEKPGRRERIAKIRKECDIGKNRWALAKTTTVDVDDWLSIDLLKRFSFASFRLVSPELKEKTSSRYVYCTFSEADRDWLKYKNPPSLPSFMDEYICKECRDEAYDVVVKKAGRTYEEIFKEDSNDPSSVGFYEWCAIKSVARLFSLGFDMFSDGFVLGREDLYGKTEKELFDAMGRREEPTLVQFFSAYRVYHRGTFYVPKNDPKGENVYGTFMLWICIVLNRLHEKKIAKTIETSLKKKHAEYAAKPPETASVGNARIVPSRVQRLLRNVHQRDDVDESLDVTNARVEAAKKMHRKRFASIDVEYGLNVVDNTPIDGNESDEKDDDDDEMDDKRSEHQHPTAKSSEPMSVLFHASQRSFHEMEEEVMSSDQSRRSSLFSEGPNLNEKTRTHHKEKRQPVRQECPPSFFFF